MKYIKYTPNNWYWSGPLGIFSSATNSIVETTDENFIHWLANNGNIATPWPKDITGNQTPEALDVVLLASGIRVSGLAISTKAQLLDYGEYVQDNIFTNGSVFNIGTVEAPVNILCDGIPATRASLALLLAWGQANPTSTDTWKDNNRVFTALTGAQFVTLATLAGAWIKNIYAFESDIETEINAGTITTMAQIDALVWPTS